MEIFEIDDLKKKAENDEPISSLDVLRLIDAFEQNMSWSRIIEGEWIKQNIILMKGA